MFMFVLFILGAGLPPWITLTVGYLAVRSIASQLNIPPVLTIGYADLYVADIFLLGIICRLVLVFLIKRIYTIWKDVKHLSGVWAFLIVTFGSTFLSYFRFGEEYFAQQFTSFMRLLVVPFGVLFLFMLYKPDFEDLKRALSITRWTGYLVAGSIFAGKLFGIGEINPVTGENSTLRYQGVLGDSVKLFLLPFIFWEILRGSIFGTVFLVVALFFTGGRWGFIGFIVGLGFIIFSKFLKKFIITFIIFSKKLVKKIIRKHVMKDLEYIIFFRKFIKNFGKHVIIVYIIITVCLLGFVLNLGGIKTRFLEKSDFEHGAITRIKTWQLGLIMGKDFWLTGAGYNAYQLLFPNYYSPDMGFVFSTETFSQIIKSLVDSGILGVITFIWMMLNFLKLAHIKSSQKDEDFNIFSSAASVTVITFLVLSPFVVWLNPGSKVGYAFMLFMGLALKIQNLQVKKH